MNIITETEYRQHPKFTWLWVSREGDILSRREGEGDKRLAVWVNHKGYSGVSVWSENRNHSLFLSRAILDAFVGPREDMQASHLNGNKQDNRLENLAWETAKENQARKKEHGTSQHGMRHGGSVLTDEQVIEIRALAASGVKLTVIADKFGVWDSNIGAIVNRQTWKHIPPAAKEAT